MDKDKYYYCRSCRQAWTEFPEMWKSGKYADQNLNIAHRHETEFCFGDIELLTRNGPTAIASRPKPRETWDHPRGRPGFIDE